MNIKRIKFGIKLASYFSIAIICLVLIQKANNNLIKINNKDEQWIFFRVWPNSCIDHSYCYVAFLYSGRNISLSHSHSHTHKHTFTHTHTNTHSQTHIQVHAHSRKVVPSLSLSIYLSSFFCWPHCYQRGVCDLWPLVCI